MTWIAFLLVFFSVFLHAGWSFLSKSTRPSGAFFLLSSSTAALLLLPVFLASDWRGLGVLPFRFWLLLTGSGCFEILYCLGLAYAYRRCDISLAYPLARALPVLLVAAVTAVFGIGRFPGVVALAGMAVITAGCLLLPLDGRFQWTSYCNRAVLFILLAAAGTTGYTIVDSVSMALLRESAVQSALRSSLQYIFMIESLIAVGLAVYVQLVPVERREFRRLFLKSPYPLISGACSASAYLLILIAMGHVSNVSFIQAFRQMSLPLGVLAGILLLKERCSREKLFGVALIVIGLMMTAFGR